jgi:hypothetical protein
MASFLTARILLNLDSERERAYWQTERHKIRERDNR